MGSSTFSFTSASYLHKSTRILSQRNKKIDVFKTWFNWYVPHSSTTFFRYLINGYFFKLNFSSLICPFLSTRSLSGYQFVHNHYLSVHLFIISLILGAVQNIINIDCKKRSDSKKVAFDFRTKKISAHGVEDDIIDEIHKFPFLLQHLIVKEACAVMNRLEKGKGTPGLTSLDCHCLFRNRYLLPCKHIFHEHMYGNTKLLTADVWKMFQGMFEESGFEVYESRESVITFVQTEKQKEVENQRLTVAELTERVHD
jgi:hypothetical protein